MIFIGIVGIVGIEGIIRQFGFDIMETMKKPSYRKKKIVYAIAVIFIILTVISFIYEIPQVTFYSFDSSKIDGDGVRFALVTDLHSCLYGRGESNTLIKLIDEQDPDAVLLGGDIYDDFLSDGNADDFLSTLVKKYPCFYVTGNHEFWSERVDEMKAKCRDMGIEVLESDCCTIEINGNLVDICGVDDPAYMYDSDYENAVETAFEKTDANHFRLLIAHRPERVSIYENYDFDMTVCGHAHGGQWRIPFSVRGIYAPHQGLFAKYVDGMTELDNNNMFIVSRGLSREKVPLPRFNNPPEIVIIDVT